jgi:hypothetical protein
MKTAHDLKRTKGILILALAGLTGIVGGLGLWFYRESVQTTSTPVTVELSPDEILHLADKARGPMPLTPYVVNDLARVSSFGSAQRPDGEWQGLPLGTILRVASTAMEGSDLWVSGIVEGGTSKEPVRIHASFLERYTPVSLANTLELSDVRLVHMEEASTSKLSVTGWLRNISSQTLSQCTVVCTFEDPGGAKLDRQQGQDMVLAPLEFLRFETAPTVTDKQFAEITIEISHATPDGLRNYLPAVVIPHSTGQRSQ